jgi:hypothetical protein
LHEKGARHDHFRVLTAVNRTVASATKRAPGSPGIGAATDEG